MPDAVAPLVPDAPGSQGFPTNPLETVERPARLFRAGDYTDRQLGIVTPEHLEAIALLSRARAEIPLDLSVHGNSDLNLPTEISGCVIPGSIHRVGDWLKGIIRIPRVIDEKLKNRNLSVHLDQFTREIKKVAVVPRGRVAGAEFAGSSITVDGAGDFVFSKADFDLPVGTSQVAGVSSTDGSKPTNPLHEALDVLRKLGLELGNDTTLESLIDRIIVAGRAVVAANSQGDDTAGGGEKEPPAPIAMSEGLIMEKPIAVTLPGSTPDVMFADPNMGGSYVPPFFRRQYRNSYRGMLEALIANGQMPARVANKIAAARLGTDEQAGDFQFSLDAEGHPHHEVLDTLIEAFSLVPRGTFLVGSARGRVQPKTGAVDFRFQCLEAEQDFPHEFTVGDSVAADGRPTAEQEDTTDVMLKMGGAEPRRKKALAE